MPRSLRRPRTDAAKSRIELTLIEPTLSTNDDFIYVSSNGDNYNMSSNGDKHHMSTFLESTGHVDRIDGNVPIVRA